MPSFRAVSMPPWSFTASHRANSRGLSPAVRPSRAPSGIARHLRTNRRFPAMRGLLTLRRPTLAPALPTLRASLRAAVPPAAPFPTRRARSPGRCARADPPIRPPNARPAESLGQAAACHLSPFDPGIQTWSVHPCFALRFGRSVRVAHGSSPVTAETDPAFHRMPSRPVSILAELPAFVKKYFKIISFSCKNRARYRAAARAAGRAAGRAARPAPAPPAPPPGRTRRPPRQESS